MTAWSPQNARSELTLELGDVNCKSIFECRSALWEATAGKAQLANPNASKLGKTNLENLRMKSPPSAMDGAGKQISGRYRVRREAGRITSSYSAAATAACRERGRW